MAVSLAVAHHNWQKLRKRLEYLKHAAQDGAAEEACSLYPNTLHPFVVEPNGERHGSRKNGTSCRWSGIYHDFMQVGIVDRPSGSDHFANMFLTVRGKGCLHASAKAWWERGQRFIRALNSTILWARLGRVDITLDMPEVSIKPFVTACREGCYVSGGCTPDITEGRGSRIWFQQKKVELRIYDKKAQLRWQRKTADLQEMIHRRWGGTEPLEALRVEFQCNRGLLKDHGIDTPEDYFRKREALVLYLTNRFRFTARKFDRSSKNHARAGELELWSQIRETWRTWANSPNFDLTPIPKGTRGVENLLKQLVGVARSIAKRRGEEASERGPLNDIWVEAVTKYGPATAPAEES